MWRERLTGRGGSALGVAAMCLALAGCYETQIPLVTQTNAHPTPLVTDGRYCELIVDATGRPRIGEGQCLTLTWVPEARGWRTDNVLIPGDAQGIAIRARKLGTGADPVGRSGLVMVQAGPPPRQAVVGGRPMPVATARLMVVLPRRDMFVVIHAGLPPSDVIARARTAGVILAAGERGLTIPALGRLTSEGADVVGAWLAREAAHEVHAAPLPGAEPDRNVIRMFVRRDLADREGQAALTERARTMLDAVVFEAGVLNEALGLGLPPARIDPARLDTRPPPSAPPVDPWIQSLYEGLQRCRGLHRGATEQGAALTAELMVRQTEARARGDRHLADEIASMLAILGVQVEMLREIEAPLAGIIDRFADDTLDREAGARALAAGRAEIAPLDLPQEAMPAESLWLVVVGFGRAAEATQTCPDAAVAQARERP